ncbi:MAG TPA: ATP-binding cassette domain-containing protein [Myxococcales bacterium]|jgi:ABC-type bacteriocin/lantibiotic exporter with double-glycine peptidase domain
MQTETTAHRQRRIIPEVIQTSATDCGPAAMKSVFAGLGLAIDYRRLREACQTDVDGSSIDKMEEICVQLGLDAKQMMLPQDHVFLPEAKVLPAIVISLTPGGRPHFVVIWARVGPFVQVMDPASGRHWMRVSTLLQRLFVHTAAAPASAWRSWAGSDEAMGALRRRLRDLGAPDEQLAAEALQDPTWKSLAALDAATRAAEAVVRGGGVKRGRMAGDLVRSMLEQEKSGGVAIPEAYWSVRPSKDDASVVFFTGSVLLRFRGWKSSAAAATEAPAGDAAAMSADLKSAVAAPPLSPAREVLRLLAQDRLNVSVLAILGLVVATAGRVLQALMLRAVLDLGRDLATTKQRALAMLAMAAFCFFLLLLQIPISVSLLGIGRRLEVRLRKAYLENLPRIEDRYFQSRLASDMASRCHAIQGMRSLPGVMAQFITNAMEVVATGGALIWAAPGQWGIVVWLSLVTLILPFIAQIFFFERDMRVQTHAGALSNFILDALLGLPAIRIHGAERSLRRGQEGLLVEWTKARYSLQELSVAFEGLLTTISYALVVWLVFAYLKTSSKASLVLLVVFWALRFPALGQRLLVLTRVYPSMMNRVRRLLEMLGNVEPEVAQPEAAAPATATATATATARGVGITLEGVQVKGGGHVLLDEVSLQIQPGEHVAIVGPSGAGKSTLVGLLLGWLRPVKGEIRVDGQSFDQAAVDELRRVTAWVDPAVQIWNTSLLDNLRYGNDSARNWSLEQALKGADMLDILETLPDGLQTSLGEGGGLVSGGQGQRVRLARAMLQSTARLAILDEAFRGLDRDRRVRLMKAARTLWAGVTLLCVSHDVVQTQEFDRVLVIENGHLVENGAPAELLAKETSRYAQLVRADEDNHRALWRGGAWRYWRLADGSLSEQAQA